MDFMEISKKRRTVRKFAQRPVEAEKVEKILEAGRWSPTAVNAQPQRILVLDAPESLSKVREFCSFGYDKKYVDLAEDFTPNTYLGGHRKPLEETCFYNAVTRE